MSKQTRRPWVVTPHQPLEQHDASLWSVEGQVPGIAAWRRMAIARTTDGGLIFYNAIPLDEATLFKVRGLGTPKALVVPHDSHGVDAYPFSQKLGIPIFGPVSTAARMREKFGDGVRPFTELNALSPEVQLEELDGTRIGELVMLVRAETGLSLVFADAYQDHSTHQAPWLFRVLGFRGGPRTPPVYRVMFMRDRQALSAHLARLAALPGLKRIVPSHGPVLDRDAAKVLAGVAADLR